MEGSLDDTFLARWADGTLSEEELQAFKESDGYEEHRLILEQMDRARFPDFDTDASLSRLKQRMDRTAASPEKSKGIIRPMHFVYAIAASLTLLLGFRFLFDSVTYQTANNEYLSFNLPDGSSVELNADSRLSYARFGWTDDRKVHLEGEAYFQVESGQRFLVETDVPMVQVLGTRFTVLSRQDYHEVECYEGRVSVAFDKSEAQELTAGQALRKIEGAVQDYRTAARKADWQNAESSFEQIPILYVLQEMERQYNIEISGKEELTDRTFTGRFGHDDLETAARTVFSAMDINYTKEDHKHIRIIPN